jgi:FkbM family methyltransferase
MLARSRTIVRVAYLVGNQCGAIVSRYLSSSSDPAHNGEVALIKRLAPELKLVIDVGANVGQWSTSVLSSAPDSELICYEPSSECVRVLHSTLPDTVEIRQIALSDHEGMEAFASERDCGTSSALLRGYTNNCEVEIEEVSTATLDSQLGTCATKIDLLKIDTEGFDFHVMRGGADLLKRQHIRFLQFEYTDRWSTQGSTLVNALAFLRANGYTVFLLNVRGLHHFDLHRWRRYLDYGNFVACTQSDLPLLQSWIAPPL